MDSTDSVTAQNRIESNRTGSSAVRVTTVVLPSCRPLRPLVRCLLYVLVVLYLLSVSSLRSFLFFSFRCSVFSPETKAKQHICSPLFPHVRSSGPVPSLSRPDTDTTGVFSLRSAGRSWANERTDCFGFIRSALHRVRGQCNRPGSVPPAWWLLTLVYS